MDQRVDVLKAEAKAVEESLRAYSQPDGSFKVRSTTRDLFWTVRVSGVKQDIGWVLKFDCGCESGSARPSVYCPCAHSACVGRSLERRGLARWVGGIWAAAGLLKEVV